MAEPPPGREAARLVPVSGTGGRPSGMMKICDETQLRARCQEALGTFGEGNVIYATKAFLCLAMARLASDEGLLMTPRRTDTDGFYVSILARSA